jgi:manganese/iron transport system permease protein
MLMIAVAVACSSAVLGTFISFHINGATGACIVLVQALAFAAAFVFAPKRGLWAVKGLGPFLFRTRADRVPEDLVNQSRRPAD